MQVADYKKLLLNRSETPGAGEAAARAQQEKPPAAATQTSPKFKFREGGYGAWPDLAHLREF